MISDTTHDCVPSVPRKTTRRLANVKSCMPSAPSGDSLNKPRERGLIVSNLEMRETVRDAHETVARDGGALRRQSPQRCVEWPARNLSRDLGNLRQMSAV